MFVVAIVHFFPKEEFREPKRSQMSVVLGLNFGMFVVVSVANQYHGVILTKGPWLYCLHHVHFPEAFRAHEYLDHCDF